MSESDRRHYFFIHVMKTGGTTFESYVADNVDAGNIYGKRDPRVSTVFRMRDYCNVHRLLMNVRHNAHRHTFLRGHFPFAATRLVEDAGTTMTILRDPVERTISFLRHAQKFHPEHRGLSLPEIYEDEWWFPRFVDNYQCKLFGMTTQQAVAPRPRPSPGSAVPNPDSSRALYEFLGPAPTELVAADDVCLARALENVGEVDVLGFSENYLDFLLEVQDRFGWRIDAMREKNRSDTAGKVPAGLRRRIERDLEADIEFYNCARRLRVRAGR